MNRLVAIEKEPERNTKTKWTAKQKLFQRRQEDSTTSNKETPEQQRRADKEQDKDEDLNTQEANQRQVKLMRTITRWGNQEKDGKEHNMTHEDGQETITEPKNS